jgi:hypothetical protein
VAVRWADFNSWSLVDVEFGSPKGKENDETAYGVNLGGEFSYRHMALVVWASKNNLAHNQRKAIVVPVTTYKNGDENYVGNVVVDHGAYGNLFEWKSTIKVEFIRHIDAGLRVKKIRRGIVAKPLKRRIQRAMLYLFAQPSRFAYLHSSQ